MMVNAKIAGTGLALPKQVVTNFDLEKKIDTSDEWIVERTGIKQRYVVSEGETSTSLATIAAKQALENANLSPDDIDAIIIATVSPDKIFPSTACRVQSQLGIKNSGPAFDITAACSGYLYAMQIADSMIKAGSAKTILIAGVELMSRMIDWEDRATCVLFGDGAGAAILQASTEDGIYSTHIHAQGQHENLLFAPGFFEEEASFLKMSGNEVFKHAVTALGKGVIEALDHNKFSASDIDWLIPHQANHRIISAVAKRLSLPMEKVIVTIDKHANTSSASIPLAMHTAIADGRIQRGDILLLEAFGGGFTWGSALLRY